MLRKLDRSVIEARPQPRNLSCLPELLLSCAAHAVRIVHDFLIDFVHVDPHFRVSSERLINQRETVL